MRDLRIASLLPSATEIVYALGLEDQLVAVTFECNEPPRARQDKRVIVGGLDTSSMAPGEIDRYVRDRLGAGGDLYTLHQDALAEVRPDLILTQDLCRVCAVPTGAVHQALDHLGCDAEVLALDPQTLSEVLDSIEAVAAVAGIPHRGVALADGLRRRLASLTEMLDGRPRPRTAVVEWVDPPFGAGHWIPDQVSAAGGTPVAGRPGRRSVPITWDDLVDQRPEVVIVAPCGFDLEGATAQARTVLDHIGERLPDTQFWAFDGDGYVVRPGPRLVDGAEHLSRLLHRELGPHDSAVATWLAGRDGGLGRSAATGSTSAAGAVSGPAARVQPAPTG